MHISEPQATAAPSKCAKMSEEPGQRQAPNGVSEAPKDTERRPTLAPGGRLKFFKDGKFILELERAREGERMSWVSVPRKTFWPPQGIAASTTPPTYSRQEGSASLSVSDDNSSIQSSPWQRDHSWKQTTPKRNLSKRLGFFFKRSRKNGIRRLKRSRKRRRPYSTSPEPQIKQENDEKEQCNKSDKLIKTEAKKTLNEIVQNLMEKGLPPQRAEMVVSPRKRILREMERLNNVENHENQQLQKRSRGKSNANTVSVSNVTITGKQTNNGGSCDIVDSRATQTTRNSCYSITSLLAEDRNVKKSSEVVSANNFVPSSTHHQQFCSPPNPPASEDRWYSESVDKLRSIELSQVEKRAYSAYSYPYMPPPHFMYPYSPYYYGRGAAYNIQPSHQPLYHHHIASNLPILNNATRPDVPTCSWTETSNTQRDDNIADMPLNLSKHAG